MKYALAGAALMAVLYLAVIRGRKQSQMPQEDGSYSYPQGAVVQGGITQGFISQDNSGDGSYSYPPGTVNVGSAQEAPKPVPTSLSSIINARYPGSARTPPPKATTGYSPPASSSSAYAPPTVPPPTTDNVNTIDHADAMPPISYTPAYNPLAPPAIVAPSSGPAVQARRGQGAF